MRNAMRPNEEAKMSDVHFLSRDHEGASYRIAYRQRNPLSAEATGKAAKQPGVLWLGGFKSDMDGSKAEALDAWADRTGRCFTRFDYFGHGVSEGAFVEGTISRWYADAEAILHDVTKGPQILVGSSMGGWIACLLAHRLATSMGDLSPIVGLVLIAPALDFTEVLMWEMMDETVQTEIMDKGQYERPSDYSDEPYIITKALIEDGRQNLLLDQPIQTNCRVHILQGQQDADVPWPHALRTAEQIAQDDVILTFVKTGDHRLSTDDDLMRMISAVEAVA